MTRAEFRDYVFPLDHPQVARLKGKDAHAHAQIARGDPFVQELLIEPWSGLIAGEERMGAELRASLSPERFHIHTIVRTPNGNDYGMDLLRMHYARAHPGDRPGY